MRVSLLEKQNWYNRLPGEDSNSMLINGKQVETWKKKKKS